MAAVAAAHIRTPRQATAPHIPDNRPVASSKHSDMGKSEINRIKDQIERLHSKHNWTGVDFYAVLNGINDEVANLELPGFNHTIHQIARHMVTDFVVSKRLQGIDHQLSGEENWIPARKIDFKWADTVKALEETKNGILRELQHIADENLDEPVLKNYTSIYVNLHGYIQHTYYHFGQIVLMAKFIENLRR